MKFYLCHSSSEKFDNFDISKFRENCLDVDTQEFGVFFYASNSKEYIENTALKKNNRRFGKRHGNETGYQYTCEVELDPKTLINPDKKISYEEAKRLVESFKCRISEEVFNSYKNNRQFFYMLCKHMYNKIFHDWGKVAQVLINAGYSGYNDMHTDPEGFMFGTIVLFDTKNINIIAVEQY